MKRQSLPWLFFRLQKGIGVLWGTFWGNWRLRWWGVRCAGAARCFGVPRIEKHPGGSIRIGRNCVLRSSLTANVLSVNHPVCLAALYDGELVIGDHFGASGAVIVARESIRIGDRVMIGANCVIVDHDFHPVDPRERFESPKNSKCAAVVIEDDVFIGMNSIVLKGVTIGRGTVVAAGSVVVKSLPPGVIAGGNPAKALRPLGEYDNINRETNLK